MSQAEQTSTKEWFAAGSAAILLILWISYHFLCWLAGEGPDSPGELGDMFGGVNALFSGLAFLGVIIAIVLQKRELELQRKELEHTREELRGQKEQLELQNETFAQQTFEATFFRLLSFQQDIVQNMTYESHKGRDCLTHFRATLQNKMQQGRTKSQDANQVDQIYMEFHANYHDHLGQYFRNLYHLISFVDRSSSKDKRTYTNLVRAQLSSTELLLLFHNGLASVGEGFKPLIEQYALLEHLPKGQLLFGGDTVFYEARAYGDPPASTDQPQPSG